jgi:membrane associated rhomboid family serine protease
MNTPRTIPYVTLTLALIITVIQVFRMLGGVYEDFVFTNLHHGNWDVFYAQPWRMITSSFIHHRNILHYLGNLVTLCLFGWQIERLLGRSILLVTFFGAMVTAYVVWVDVMDGWLIGISGGVCGLFGLSLIANRRTPWWTTLTQPPLHLFYLLFLAAPLFPFFANIVDFKVAHLGHLIGILYGMLVGGAFLLLPRWRWVAIALPLVLFVSPLYSPWKLEWQMVQKQASLLAENPECRLQSIEQEIDMPSLVDVVNERAGPVAVFRLDYEGNPEFILWLGKNETTGMNSWIGHPFCIIDIDSGMSVATAMVTEPEQTITIR